MIARFYLSLLSLAVITATLVMAAYAAGGSLPDVPEALAWDLFVFGGVNVLLARAAFRPVERAIVTGTVTPAAQRRLDALPVFAAAWTMLLCQLAVLPALYFERLMPDLLSLAGPIAFYSLFLAVFMFFLVGDYTARVREFLFLRHGLELAPGRQRLAVVLVIAFASVSLLPLTLSVFEEFFQARLGIIFGLRPVQTFWVNVAATLLLVLSTVFLILRTLTRPVARLSAAVERVSRGDLDVRVAVTTADELGHLSRGFNDMVRALRDRKFMRETFGRFVPAAVATAILADRSIVRPRVSEATILFTDIAGFTAVSEQLEPEQVLALLNEYFGAVGAVIGRYGGVITQFQGDAILATFNLPVADPQHAASALRAAAEIIDLCAHRRFLDRWKLTTRIGVNTGPIVGGTVGDADRLGYTVNGDAVNLAARLEELNKELGTRCLVSARTVELAGDAVRCTPLGEVKVRGRTRAVRVYTLA